MYHSNSPVSEEKSAPPKPRPKTPSVEELTRSSPDPKSRFQSSSSTSPSSQRTYDPRTLLAPRAAPRQGQTPQPSPYMSTLHSSSLSRGTMDVDTISNKRELQRESSGGGSRLEDLYGVQPRAEQARKKVKRDTSEDKITTNRSHAHHSNGTMGEYMKPDDPDKGVALTIDLTNGE
jgi:hypothetical protein